MTNNKPLLLYQYMITYWYSNYKDSIKESTDYCLENHSKRSFLSTTPYSEQLVAAIQVQHLQNYKKFYQKWA